MPLLPADEQHLRNALDRARAAAAFASPNPTVGCVLTRNEIVIGEGAHYYDELDHAEVVALKAAAAADHTARGATAYVTLEPCSHHGRTGPCADALIAAGIARCVVATIDPNPVVSGSGMAKLRNAGIEVHVLKPTGPPAVEARRLNDAFAFSIQHGRPFVTLKAAVSAEGMIAPSPDTRTVRKPFWLTGEEAREQVQQLRHASDAIVTGISTVLADDPLLTDRSGKDRRRPLLRVVLDTHLRTPLDSQLVRSAKDEDVMIFCNDNTPNDGSALLAAGVQVHRVKGYLHSLDLRAVLAELYARNIRSVLVEAGSHVNGSFLDAELVDRVVLYQTEHLLGPDAVPFAFNSDSIEGRNSVKPVIQRLTHREQASFASGNNTDTRITGYLHDPWADLNAGP